MTHCKCQNAVADPGVVRLNPPDPKPTSSNNTFQCKKNLSVPMILDVRLNYFGSLGLVYYSYNQETYRFFHCLSSSCTVQRQARSKRGVAIPKVGVVDENFSALHTHNKKNPPSQYPASTPGTRNSMSYTAHTCT